MSEYPQLRTSSPSPFEKSSPTPPPLFTKFDPSIRPPHNDIIRQERDRRARMNRNKDVLHTLLVKRGLATDVAMDSTHVKRENTTNDGIKRKKRRKMEEDSYEDV